MKIHSFLILLVMTSLSIACTKEEIKKDDRPDWIDKPEPNFVGKSATHVMGP